MNKSFVLELGRIVGSDGVVAKGPARAVYECDGYTLERAVPDAVVLPRSVDEVRRVVRWALEEGWNLVPRGAGTSLAGGCLAGEGSLVLALTRMRALEVLDPLNRQALVQAGLPNLALSRAALPHGLHFAPDPSSQAVSTLGGNIANNSGGPHTLKMGVTVNHVLALELVTPDGEVHWLGSRVPARGGPDLCGLAVGSEGTFGIVTRAWVRLVPLPESTATLTAAFRSAGEATRAVSTLIASGVVPAAVEMMDRPILGALREAFGMDVPEDAEAFLLVEVDGPEIAVEEEARDVHAAMTEAGAFAIRRARDARERTALWAARKRAFGAIGRLARNYCTQDGVVPRTRLPAILDTVYGIAGKHRLRVANVFHAGDGNLHPVFLYDERDQDQVRRVLEASAEVLNACLDAGGSLTGEHGIGVEKIALMSRAFDAQTLDVMRDIRRVFDPGERSNPGKGIPSGGGCADTSLALGRVAPGRRAPL